MATPLNLPDIQFSIVQTNENTVEIMFSLNGEQEASPALCRHIAACCRHLQQVFSTLIVDCVASYISILVYYDFARVDSEDFIKRLSITIQSAINTTTNAFTGKQLEIPVYYSEATGPDLVSLAEQKNISVQTLIQYHSEKPYTVYAVGFAPGFAYLGFVDDILASPRIAKPRKHVPKGAVGIADRQTGIYPCDSPGGWNIIGQTPLTIFDSSNPLAQCNLLQVGDTVRFKPINKQSFLALSGQRLSEYAE